ncbi:EamA family transporter [Mycolicibacterium houstonense]|uniref:EamA family transporter n=1 Tax=Mycolicibacterium houstonense TaxID=146021 RepID=UPI003F9DA6D7
MTAEAQLERGTADNDFRLGLLFAVSSALAFGSSGPFAKALMESGWSPTSAVIARLAGGALIMAAFASVVRPGWIREVAGHARTVVGYGLIPIAGAQLCYYNAVAHLSVGVALLLEYTAPILVVGWVWATTRHRPSAMTFGGVALAIAGIIMVLNVFSGAQINLVGVGWGLAAAVCAACYFMMSNRASTDGGGLSPISLATGGLIVGTTAVTLLGVTGIMPLAFTADPVTIAGRTTSWLVPVIALGLIPTALAYTLGIVGISRLKPRFASLVGLSEVLFAVLIAWIMLGEAMSTSQVIGGAVVLVGLAVARQGDRGEQAQPEAAELPTWPDMPMHEATERAND